MKGNRLSTEEELVHQFGVSRVSVRQALIVLHEMGLVENRPGSETFVTNEAKERSLSSLTAALLSEIELLKGPLEVKRILEPEVTSFAALRVTPKDTAAMARIISLQEVKVKKGIPITDEDTLFHEAIAKSTKNSILRQIVEFLHQQLRTSRHQSLIVPGGNRRSIEDHKYILQAISKKNPQEAYQAMATHLRNVERLITQALKLKKD